MKTPDRNDGRPAMGEVSGATEIEDEPAERGPFSREYLDFWALTDEAA